MRKMRLYYFLAIQETPEGRINTMAAWLRDNITELCIILIGLGHMLAPVTKTNSDARLIVSPKVKFSEIWIKLRKIHQA